MDGLLIVSDDGHLILPPLDDLRCLKVDAEVSTLCAADSTTSCIAVDYYETKVARWQPAASFVLRFTDEHLGQLVLFRGAALLQGASFGSILIGSLLLMALQGSLLYSAGDPRKLMRWLGQPRALPLFSQADDEEALAAAVQSSTRVAWSDVFMMADAWSSLTLLVAHSFVAEHLLFVLAITVLLPPLLSGFAMCAIARAWPATHPRPEGTWQALRCIRHVARFCAVCALLALLGIPLPPPVHHIVSREFCGGVPHEKAHLLWVCVVAARFVVQACVFIADLSLQPLPLPVMSGVVVFVARCISACAVVLLFVIDAWNDAEEPREGSVYELVLAESGHTVFTESYGPEEGALFIRQHSDASSGAWFRIEDDGCVSIMSNANGRPWGISSGTCVANTAATPSRFAVRPKHTGSHFAGFKRTVYEIEDQNSHCLVGAASCTCSETLDSQCPAGRLVLDQGQSHYTVSTLFYLRRLCEHPCVPVAWLGQPHMYSWRRLCSRHLCLKAESPSLTMHSLKPLHGRPDEQHWELLAVSLYRRGLRCYIRVCDGGQRYLGHDPQRGVCVESAGMRTAQREWLISPGPGDTWTIRLFGGAAPGAAQGDSPDCLTADWTNSGVYLAPLRGLAGWATEEDHRLMCETTKPASEDPQAWMLSPPLNWSA